MKSADPPVYTGTMKTADLAQLRHSIAYLQATIDALLDVVDYNDDTGCLIDELVGVALHNVLLDAGMADGE